MFVVMILILVVLVAILVASDRQAKRQSTRDSFVMFNLALILLYLESLEIEDEDERATYVDETVDILEKALKL